MSFVNYVVLGFEETSGAGTYTASVPLPPGSVVVLEGYKTIAAWDADTATLDVGVTGDLEGIESNVNVKAVFSTGNDPSGGTVPYRAYEEEAIVASVVTTGAGGATGRTKVFVGYTSVAEVTAAKT